MITEASKVHLSIPARNVRELPLEQAQKSSIAELRKLGFGVANDQVAMDMAMGLQYAADSVQGTVTTPSIPNPIQFLQQWLPGHVNIFTKARRIDDLIGISTVGQYEDDQIVQSVIENTGYAIPYGDMTNLPLSSWNQTFVPRTVVRFESGMRVGNLEEARASRTRVNVSDEKRKSCGRDLEIQRNNVGFSGYNSGNDSTYGFLNDTGLPAYVTVANSGTGSSTLWSEKDYLEIVQDLLTAFVQLRTQTGDVVDAKNDACTLALPTNAVDYLSTTTDFGYTVYTWLRDNYPKVRVVSAPQLNTANGGSGVFYLYADKISDGLSTDGGDTWIQAVPARFMVQGVQKMVKGYEEGYIMATAGAMCKRPILVTRWTGIS